MKNNSLNRDFNVRNISFKSNLFISYIAQCSTIGSKFLQVTLINLNFGLETFGEFTLLVSINNIITTLLSFGSADAISIFFKEESLKRENSNPLLVIFLNFLITSISNLMLLIIIYFLLPFLNKTIGNDSTLAIFFYSIVSVINNYRSITHGYMNANMMYKKINFINSLDVIVKTLFIFFFILLVKDYSLLNIVKPVVFGGMLVFIIEIIFAINHFKKNQTSKLRIKPV